MKKLLFTLSIVTLLHSPARGQSLRIMNAASFSENTSFAAGSIISVFGSNLTNTTASAASANSLPRTLGGVTLTIGGVASPLFYVSPTQINAQIDTSVAPGPAAVTLTSPTGTFTTTIQIASAAAPGIFALSTTGSGDGAILNAATFAGGVYSVTTNGSPTFLAIFATGLDRKTAPTVRIGGVAVPVQYFGPAPGFPGLQQVNVQLTSDLDGAGRVEVELESGGVASNVVETMIVPRHGEGAFPADADNQMPNRAIASIAYVPGTSLALVADEYDDVVRVLDVQQKAVTHVISLMDGSRPIAIAVNAAGTAAVVAEQGTNKVAVLDLTKYAVTGEVAVGMSPVSVAIWNTTALAVNQGSDSVTFVDMTALKAGMVTAVGKAPRAVALDGTGHAFVTNENDGTISQIDLGTGTVLKTIGLGMNARPEAIQIIPSLNLAVVTEPSQSPSGQVVIVNLTTANTTIVNVNPARSGGSSDLAVNGSTVYFANQAGGSVTAVPVSVLASGSISATPTTVKVDLGARALAVDTRDNLLLVTNQGTGTVVLVDLASNKVTGRINAVASPPNQGDNDDDHSDHDHAFNMPVVMSFSPASAKIGTNFTLVVNGQNLSGVTSVAFYSLGMPGKGDDHGEGIHASPIGQPDPSISVSGIQVNTAGTQLTAQVQIAASAAAGQRLIRVQGPNGASVIVAPPMMSVFTVTQ